MMYRIIVNSNLVFGMNRAQKNDMQNVHYEKRQEREGMGINTRYYSKKQEKKVAKATNGRRTANSGATAFQKGDVVTNDWLIECKTKVKDSTSFTIKEEWLLKNEEEAFAMGKSNSALAFDFGPSSDRRYYVISEKLFQLLQQYLEEDK